MSFRADRSTRSRVGARMLAAGLLALSFMATADPAGAATAADIASALRDDLAPNWTIRGQDGIDHPSTLRAAAFAPPVQTGR